MINKDNFFDFNESFKLLEEDDSLLIVSLEYPSKDVFPVFTHNGVTIAHDKKTNETHIIKHVGMDFDVLFKGRIMNVDELNLILSRV
jgi:hypothetical protein